MPRERETEMKRNLRQPVEPHQLSGLAPGNELAIHLLDHGVLWPGETLEVERISHSGRLSPDAPVLSRTCP